MSGFDIVSPLDNRVAAHRRYAGLDAIEAAAGAAEAALPAWRERDLVERCALVDGFVRELEARRARIADAVTLQMGRPRPQADEMGRLRLVADDCIARAPALLAPRRIDGGDGILRYVTHDAIGPCLSICAWNYPVAMLGSLILHPLIAGNVVLLKHAPETAMIGDFVNEAAAAAGLPHGVLQALDMTHEACDALLRSGRFPIVQFIGSTRGGREVARAGGAGLAHLGLELGGSDPAYIRPDAPMASIVADLVEGAFGNAGQSCCSVERIYVHEAVYDDFVDAFREAAGVVTLGHPIASPGYIGPLVSRAAAQRVRGLVEGALRAGAREILPSGGSPLAGPDNAYLEPRILLDVTHDMDLIHTEIFGPLVSVLKVKDDAEAVARMNDSDYGLTASIWSADLDRAQALGRQVQSGTFYVNRCDHADIHLPWGGVKQSGIGRSYAEEGFAELTVPRAWHVRPLAG